MKSKISQVITGSTLIVVSVLSTIHASNLHAQAIIDWANSPEGYNSYQSKYALVGTEFMFLGIICCLVGFVFLIAGLFKPVSNYRR